MAIILFAVMLHWVPPYGLKTWKGYILPIAVLTIEQMALLTRVMRGATIETLSQHYVRTARAKGLTDYPHIVISPGEMIVITVLAFNFLGDGLRDAPDPRQRAE